MMMSSLARVKFIKTKVLFSQVSYQGRFRPSFIKFATRNKELFTFKFQYQNEKKTKKWGKNFWVTKRGNKGIIGAGFRTGNRGKRDYIQGQLQGYQIRSKRLQIGANKFQIGAGVINRGRKIAMNNENKLSLCLSKS